MLNGKIEQEHKPLRSELKRILELSPNEKEWQETFPIITSPYFALKDVFWNLPRTIKLIAGIGAKRTQRWVQDQF